MEIVTGYRGKPHITSEKWADLNRGIIGAEEYVLGVGRMFESELVSNNLLKIYDGCGVFQGREFSTSAGQSDEITIENGTQREKRIDLIVARYTKNEDTKIETIEPVLIKGTPSASDPAVPKYTEGNIRQGDLIADMPLYEVELNGINVVEVRPLFRALMDMNKINKYLSELSDKLKTEHFLTKSNHTEYLTIGNLRGGKIENISGNKCGNVVTLYVQIGGITQGGADVSIFQFKEKYRRKYGPSNYAVHNAYISKQNNIVYIGQFNDAHFSMAIAGNGEISASNPAQIIFTITYLTD